MPFGKHKSIVSYCKKTTKTSVLQSISLFIVRFFTTAFYGIIFPSEEEAAFSNYRLWESLGLAVVFSYSTAFCTDVKLYIMMTLLVLGMIGYFTIEIMERNKRNKEKVSSRGGAAAARGWRVCMQNSCYF
jgi:hypothetical protein